MHDSMQYDPIKVKVTSLSKNTVKHCDGGVGSVVANYRGGGECSLVVTTLLWTQT